MVLSKLNTEAVEAARWLVSQRISSKTVLAWRTIAAQLSLPTEGLPQGLADALNQYGTLNVACRTKTAERGELSKQVEKLKAEATTLKVEKQRIRAALGAISKDGQGQVQSVEKIATSAVNSVNNQAEAAIKATRNRFEQAINRADEYMGHHPKILFERLTKESAELERDVAFARALRS